MTSKRFGILFFIVLFVQVILFAQDNPADKPSGIQWLDIETAQEKLKEESRKLIVDVYTNWCGWCKKMDAIAFSDPIIVKYISENYYAVKLNAESAEEIVFKGVTYINPNAGQKRATHQLASIAAVEGRLGYPTIVYIDENLNLLSQVPGYLDAKGLEPIIHFFAEEAYQNQSYDEFRSGFKSSFE